MCTMNIMLTRPQYLKKNLYAPCNIVLFVGVKML